jgi:hypothetical protein
VGTVAVLVTSAPEPTLVGSSVLVIEAGSVGGGESENKARITIKPMTHNALTIRTSSKATA